MAVEKVLASFSLNEEDREAGRSVEYNLPDWMTDLDGAIKRFGKDVVTAYFRSGITVAAAILLRRTFKDTPPAKITSAEILKTLDGWKPGAGRPRQPDNVRLAKRMSTKKDKMTPEEAAEILKIRDELRAKRATQKK